MNAEPTRSGENFETLVSRISGKQTTARELEESISPDSDVRLRSRLEQQTNAIAKSQGPKAWDW